MLIISLRNDSLCTVALILCAGRNVQRWALLSPDPLTYTVILERVTELAVLISLFAVGLKLGLPLSDKGWRLPVRLAIVSITITVALIAAIGVLGLGLSLGAAVLLGAILAPTDPVLASDVQVLEAGDRDRLRFSLTGEGGLNDGAAFPFVMLGLGLMGLHDLGTGGWRWLAVDVLWAIAGGLLIGGTLGTLIGRLVAYLRSRHKESVGFDEFLALGLIALAYGLAVVSCTYGFLAVFAAGLARQRVNEQPISDVLLPETGLQGKQADFLVRHPRHRLDLLPDVRNQPRPAASPGGGNHRSHAHRGGRLHRGSRGIRDALDGSLCAAQVDAPAAALKVPVVAAPDPRFLPWADQICAGSLAASVRCRT